MVDCTHHWMIEPADSHARANLLGVCVKCSGTRLFNRTPRFKYPKKEEYEIAKRCMELEDWLDQIAPRHPDAEDVHIFRRRQTFDFSTRRRAAAQAEA